MISLLIYILVLCIVLALIWWIVGMLPLPAPAKQIVTVVIVVIFVLALVFMLLPLAGNPPHWPTR